MPENLLAPNRAMPARALRISGVAALTIMAVVAATPGTAALAQLRPAAEDEVAPAPPVERKGVFEVCPVDRPHHYVDDFGDARWSGGYHRHEGIDIFARHGTPIRAPFDGRVEGSSNWAGGLAVRVFGRLGFVYNAHLSRLGKRGRVEAGAIVGYVGSSGNARGSSPHDHFEWHPHGGTAVDPFPLLKRACRSDPSPAEDRGPATAADRSRRVA